jgi:uncharacterized metal-binding protein
MASCGCGGTKKRAVMLYGCSGGANVAEVSDLAAREMMFAGDGTMYCLAGIGAGIEGMIQTAKAADVNLIVDGCPMDCGKKVFDSRGLTNYRQFRVTDLGIEKTKGIRATPDQVARVVAKAREMLREPCC